MVAVAAEGEGEEAEEALLFLCFFFFSNSERKVVRVPSSSCRRNVVSAANNCLVPVSFDMESIHSIKKPCRADNEAKFKTKEEKKYKKNVKGLLFFF